MVVDFLLMSNVNSVIQVLAWRQECRNAWNAENEAAGWLLRFGLEAD
jgi:hypothetical protein